MATHSSVSSSSVRQKTSARLSPSDLVGGRYRLERDMRVSDAGVVYSAEDTATGRTVAVEIATQLRDPGARSRFKRDAMTAQRLEGDHVLGILDVGALADGTPWVVREPVLSSMASEIARRGRVGTQQAVAWTLEVCEAVAEGHALGFAHGDIRPDTVHIARGAGGAPIVKVQWATGAKAMKRVREDASRDIQSIAHLLRALCTGRLVSYGLDDAPTLPSEVVQIVARADSSYPRDRFLNLAALARALAPFAPAGHDGARNVEFLLCRAGIVTHEPEPTVPQALSAPERTRDTGLPPPSSVRRVARQEADSDDWFLEDSSQTTARSSRAARFATVSFLVLGAVIAATMAMSTSRHLPSWATAAAPDAPILTEIAAAPTVTSGQPETIAWADRLTEEAVDDLARIPPVSNAKAEREKGMPTMPDEGGDMGEPPSLAAPIAPPARPAAQPPPNNDANPAVPATTSPPPEPSPPLPTTTPPELPPEPAEPSS